MQMEWEDDFWKGRWKDAIFIVLPSIQMTSHNIDTNGLSPGLSLSFFQIQFMARRLGPQNVENFNQEFLVQAGVICVRVGKQ